MLTGFFGKIGKILANNILTDFNLSQNSLANFYILNHRIFTWLITEVLKT